MQIVVEPIKSGNKLDELAGLARADDSESSFMSPKPKKRGRGRPKKRGNR